MAIVLTISFLEVETEFPDVLGNERGEPILLRFSFDHCSGFLGQFGASDEVQA